MPPGRKRRVEVEESDSATETTSQNEAARNTQRRRRNPLAEPEDDVRDEDEDDLENNANDSTMLGGDADTGAAAGDVDGSMEQLAKKLVRYALACEFGRVPIRREGIREKVFGKHNGRKFQQIFDAAQWQLQTKFGMEMTELPLKEKVTLRDRRVAAQKPATISATRAYVLTSTVPKKYNIPAILPPSRTSSASAEGAYIGLYTLVVSVITLGGGNISNEKLMRHLRRLNAEENTPLDKTESLLAKMQKQGYIVKIKDNSSGDDITEWMVGPRGKVEIGKNGVRGLVETVYGESAPEDLNARLRVSLGIKDKAQEKEREGEGEGQDGEREEREVRARIGRGRPRRVQVEDNY